MSILIKGMDMPRSCEECPFENRKYNLSFCVAGAYKIHTWDNRRLKGRNPDCPLIELPKHGRLIDADALASVYENSHLSVVAKILADAPTVIEAEE